MTGDPMVRDVIQISSNRRLQFHKRRQLFIGAHNEPLSVGAVRVSNKDFWPTLLTGGRAFFNCALGS
jgi:hypothetical protein